MMVEENRGVTLEQVSWVAHRLGELTRSARTALNMIWVGEGVLAGGAVEER